MDNNNQKDSQSNKKFILVGALILVFGFGFITGTKKDLIVNRINHSGISSEQTGLPNKLDYTGVEEIYSELKSNFDGNLDQNKLEDGLKSGLVKATGDPYTEYFTPEEAKDFSEDLSGSFEGIGAELGKDKDSIVIISPISGYPAEKAGIKPKDIIVEINGESTTDLNISEAVKKIRGPKGTKVTLGIVRDGKKIDIDIVRDQINIPSVTSEVVDNIGVIKISRYGEDTVELANKYADELKTKNVKGIILDLRGDPGGLLDAAVGVSELWVDKGSTILQEKRGDKVIKTHLSEKDPILSGMKTVVLINEGSASASEITAGALKDNGKATIIGVKSYGKGSVQEVRNLDFGGALKVTVARWYTPNGRNIDKEGISPDKEVKLTDDDIKAVKDPQKDAAISFLKQ